MGQLLLYSTCGCHLCEEAQEVIRRALGLPVEEVDIALDEALMARYGVRIPVLRRLDTGAEIGWPFSEKEVRVLVK